MKCPTCGCEKFYVKDVDDEYEIYEFTTSGGKVAFEQEYDQNQLPNITSEIDTFCNKCAWHGKFETLE